MAGRSEAGLVELTWVDLEGACQGVASSGLDPARIRSLTADGETVVAKAQDGGLFVSADGGSTFIPADDRSSGAESGGALWGRAGTSRPLVDAPGMATAGPFAVRGGLVAYGARKGGIVRGGKGKPWSPVVWEAKVTALAFTDDAGTLAVATYSEADDTTALVRVGSAGEALLVARIGKPGPGHG